MTKEEIYQSMHNWEQEMGEDFFDYFGASFKAVSFMCWALGRGYITVEQFNQWETDRSLDSDDAGSCVYCCYGLCKPYVVVAEDDWTAENQKKAYRIFAEFVSESVSYQKKLKEFLEENPI